MGISRATLNKIKAANLSDLVKAEGGVLKRVGREFVTTCVWHEDTNPSLTINDDKGFCFCHVCRQGGDGLDYLQQRKGIGLQDASELAGTILGIAVEYDNIDPEKQRRATERRKQALMAIDKEQKGYKENLRSPKAGRIRDILKMRGITPAASKEFGIGFAATGFFAGRITVPIFDHRNQLVGWTGRATKSKEEQPAKYKNSQDSELFQKKQLVFNEARAKEAARLSGSLIFVEGHLDVISLWQAGIHNVVAAQGTGAPDVQVLKRLSRHTKTLILCFDGDQGGTKAVEQFISAAGPMAMKGDVSILVAKMPEGMDPDEVIQAKGEQFFHNLLHDATPWLDWVIDEWVGTIDKTNGAMVTEVERRLRDMIDGLHSNALRAHYIDRASRALSINEKDADKIAKGWGDRIVEIEKCGWTVRDPHQTRIVTSRRMLRIYVHRPTLREQLAPLLECVDHPPLVWLVRRMQELEECCATDLTPHSIMAVVAASEPHFLQQLRTIIQPTVTIDDSAGVLEHCSDILRGDLPQDFHEPDPDQPSSF